MRFLYPPFFCLHLHLLGRRSEATEPSDAGGAWVYCRVNLWLLVLAAEWERWRVAGGLRSLCVGAEHWPDLIVEPQDMRLVERKDTER